MSRTARPVEGSSADAGAAAGEPRPAAVPASRRRGFATLLVIVYAVFALSASARAGYQVLTGFERAPVAYAFSLLSALTYIVATVLLARRGGDSRAALVVVVAELVGVLCVGTLTVLDPQLFPEASVWSYYGIGYAFIPLLLPVVAIAYLARRRTAARRRAGDGTV
ncbi:hypothetical protein [Brachybacterium phenoliresistens]|uniref:Membrane protein n=1 Tax=Brachybacterium phenoliresistens TaxID=396014 RepID=Z9JY09_9MICO|nr:hypothetical protein [Brachybacterium phenoliresistens]EWS82677.1 membrane protein [Brachybacterium phenoliresistens]